MRVVCLESSATRPTGRTDCNRDVHAGFATGAWLGGDMDALFVMQGVRSALRNMPKHAGRVNYVDDPQAPRLNRRRFWCRHAESCGQIE